LELLSGENRPTAIIARMALQVTMVLEVAEKLGLRVPDDLTVIFANLRTQLPSGVSIPHFGAELNLQDVGATLAKLRACKEIERYRTTYPVHFVDLK
jgi:hypothetical protein